MEESVSNPASGVLCSAIVATYKRSGPLRMTLESLLRQTFSPLEIVVVSDGEDAEVRAAAKDFASEQRVRWVFHAENMGLAATRNTGAKNAAGRYLLFVDDDIVADPECVALHMKRHSGVSPQRRVVVCGSIREDSEGRILSPMGMLLSTVQQAARADGTAAIAKGAVEADGDALQRSLWCGLNCSISRDVFEATGGFNEQLRDLEEEMEYGERLFLHGVEFLYEPGAVMLHRDEKDLVAHARKVWRLQGEIDTFRVRRLGQKTAQVQRWTSPVHGPWPTRMAGRVAWHMTGSMQAFANRLETAGVARGAWVRCAHAAEYWGAVKKAGGTLEQMRGVAGRERVALMLHSIAAPKSPKEASYYVAPERFSKLMRKFKSVGYKTATLAQWLEDTVPSKHVLMTFDDAYDDLYEHLLPLVIEHGYKPLIFVVADHVGDENRWDQKTGLRARKLMSAAQLREMQKYGVEFGSHTLTHPWLPDVSDEQLYREVIDSKKKLEDLFGTEMASFAYPYGGVDRRVHSAVAAAGYKVAFTTQPGANWWNDPLCQRRAEVNEYTSAGEFMSLLKRGERWRSSFSRDLRALEAQLPTQTLRKIAGGMRSVLKSGSNWLDERSGRPAK